MDEKQEKRLREYGVLVLPDEIDHEAYELVLDATLMRPNDPITIHCSGSGGSTWDALAIVDLVQVHGACIGILAGTSASAHLDIYAACRERYIYPNGRIGIHEAGYSGPDGKLDMNGSKSYLNDLEQLNLQIAQLYASASTLTIEYWQTMLRQVGNSGCRWMMADEVIAWGMARPVAEWKPVWLVNGNVIQLANGKLIQVDAIDGVPTAQGDGG